MSGHRAIAASASMVIDTCKERGWAAEPVDYGEITEAPGHSAYAMSIAQGWLGRSILNPQSRLPATGARGAVRQGQVVRFCRSHPPERTFDERPRPATEQAGRAP